MEPRKNQKIKVDPSKLTPKRQKEPAVDYKTEDQLKEEALRRLEEQRLIEAARKPKPQVVKKADNFWFHHKNHVIAGVIVLVLAAFFVRDVIFQTKPDFMVITVSQNFIPSEASQELADYLSARVPDVNGDGKTIVSVDAITIPREAIIPDLRDPATAPIADPMMSAANPEMEMANVMKLMAMISTNTDPLFLLDDAAFDYLLRTSSTTTDEQGNPLPIMAIDPEEAFQMFYPLSGDRNDLTAYGIPLADLDIPLEGGIARFQKMSFYLRNWENHDKNQQLFQHAKQYLADLEK